MKNLFVILVLLTSSLSIFSCTTDDNDLVEETQTTTPKEEIAIGEGDVFDDRDPD